MAAKVISSDQHQLVLEVKIDLKSSMLESERSIFSAAKELGKLSTQEILKQLESKGPAGRLNDQQGTPHRRELTDYQTPFGHIQLKRSVYQNAEKTEDYYPLEDFAEIEDGITPLMREQILHETDKRESPNFLDSPEATKPLTAGSDSLKEKHFPEKDVELMTQTILMYYLEEMTQGDIAKKLNLSRSKVGRLLRKARQQGMVEINIHPHPFRKTELETELMKRFGLKKALISIDKINPEEQKKDVAGLVAKFLDRFLEDDMVVTAGLGSNVGAVADYVFHPIHRQCLFVSAMGGTANSNMNPDHICRKLSARFGGECESLYAPAYIVDEMTRDNLLNHATIRKTLDKAKSAEVAIIGIGDLGHESNTVRIGTFFSQELSMLQKYDAVGEILGYYFFDIGGHLVMDGWEKRVIGLDVGDLRNIPNVIAVASESSKVMAILGALRIGCIDILATSASIAQKILTLEKAIHPQNSA